MEKQSYIMKKVGKSFILHFVNDILFNNDSTIKEYLSHWNGKLGDEYNIDTSDLNINNLIYVDGKFKEFLNNYIEYEIVDKE